MQKDFLICSCLNAPPANPKPGGLLHVIFSSSKILVNNNKSFGLFRKMSENEAQERLLLWFFSLFTQDLDKQTQQKHHQPPKFMKTLNRYISVKNS